MSCVADTPKDQMSNWFESDEDPPPAVVGEPDERKAPHSCVYAADPTTCGKRGARAWSATASAAAVWARAARSRGWASSAAFSAAASDRTRPDGAALSGGSADVAGEAAAASP